MAAQTSEVFRGPKFGLIIGLPVNAEIGFRICHTSPTLDAHPEAVWDDRTNAIKSIQDHLWLESGVQHGHQFHVFSELFNCFALTRAPPLTGRSDESSPETLTRIVQP